MGLLDGKVAVITGAGSGIVAGAGVGLAARAAPREAWRKGRLVGAVTDCSGARVEVM